MIMRFWKSFQPQPKCIQAFVFFVSLVVDPVFVTFVVKAGNGCYD